MPPHKVWRGETPVNIYKVKVPKLKHHPNRQTKLHVNAYTRERMFSPIMITVTEGSMLWFQP